MMVRTKLKIKDIFPNIKIDKELGNFAVSGISDDSRLINKGDIFFIIPRKNFDIFLAVKGIKDEAVVFVARISDKNRLKKHLGSKPVIFVKDIKKEFCKAADCFYGFDNKRLSVIGITGTNGKTTTAYLIYYILRKMEANVSLIGTVNYFVGPNKQEATHTTPDFLSLRKIFQKMSRKNKGLVVMEVSSHGIDQERVKGINFSRCIFTNLSRDHLDYHKTMEKYFNTKKKLFLHNRKALSLINIDDAYGRRIFKSLKRGFSYGSNPQADFRACNIKLNKKGSMFDLVHRGKTYPVVTCLLGQHNVLNIIAALGLISSLGFSLREGIRLIPHFKNVDGRLEKVHDGIFVDYAHTPDALENALCALKDSGYKKIICVFGCGGDRDKGKRKIMGGVASRLADFTFITSDNSRSEDPLKICSQISKGFKNKHYSIVVDRKKAIQKAIKIFYKKKTNYKNAKISLDYGILIAGKGHESYQLVGDRKFKFKDSRVIRKITAKHRQAKYSETNF